MSVYVWQQMNSMGVFTMPALNILVEAPSATEARDYARETWRIQFDGNECPGCCGSRWPDYLCDEDGGERPLKDVIAEIRCYPTLGNKGTVPLYVCGSTLINKLERGELWSTKSSTE